MIFFELLPARRRQTELNRERIFWVFKKQFINKLKPLMSDGLFYEPVSGCEPRLHFICYTQKQYIVWKAALAA
jgi:hypothetical protein